MKAVAESFGADPEPFTFPYTTDPVSGRCEQLGGDGLCRVYDDRPLLCNVDRMATWLNIDKETFYRLNAGVCNVMIRKAGLDPKYLVNA